MTWDEAERKERDDLRKALTDATAELHDMRRLVLDVACSPLEVKDRRMSYVVAQIDFGVWDQLEKLKENDCAAKRERADKQQQREMERWQRD